MTELYNDSIQLPVGLRNTDIYAHAYRTCVTRCDVNITVLYYYLLSTRFFIRTKFIRTQAFRHPEIKNMIRTQGFPQQ